MNGALLLHGVVGGSTAAFFALFCVTSVRERVPRAALLSGLCCAAVVACWSGAAWWLRGAEDGLWLPNAAVLLCVALFFLPLGRTRAIARTGTVKRVDERDVMFSREDYVPGSEQYEQYYELRPENKLVDDRIRALPELLSPEGKLYDALESTFISVLFEPMREMVRRNARKVSDTPPELSPAEREPANLTRTIKRFARQLGAREVGVARLDPDWVYSHVGRGPEPWGAPIENSHRYAIMFTVEMAYDRVQEAPRAGLTTETGNRYLQAATISRRLARFIRRLGAPARDHISGSNYQLMLPPVAVDAGLGELGRFGFLISRGVGARVRLGAVTTDLELVPDEPVAFGVREFCELCKRCATNCPSGSIPAGGRVLANGTEKWPLEPESCLQYWRFLGTDCGLCMKVCPYAHPDTLVHRIIRFAIARSPFARRLSTWGEDVFYGRTVRAPRLTEILRKAERAG